MGEVKIWNEQTYIGRKCIIQIAALIFQGEALECQEDYTSLAHILKFIPYIRWHPSLRPLSRFCDDPVSQRTLRCRTHIKQQLCGHIETLRRDWKEIYLYLNGFGRAAETFGEKWYEPWVRRTCLVFLSFFLKWPPIYASDMYTISAYSRIPFGNMRKSCTTLCRRSTL